MYTKKHLISIFIFLSLITQKIAIADDKAALCDKALKSCQAVIEQDSLMIKQQDVYIQQLIKDRQEALEQVKKESEVPQWGLFFIGVAGGFVLGSFLR